MAGQLKRGDTVRIRGLVRRHTVRQVCRLGWTMQVRLNLKSDLLYPADQLIKILTLPGYSV